MAHAHALARASDFPPVSEQDHRISNSLSIIGSLLHLKARQTDIDDAREVLLDVAGRIETVARLHRLLAHSTAARVPLGTFLTEVCDALQSFAVDGARDTIAVECPPGLSLPSESALRIGLLTAELFSNSVKYAHPTGLPTTMKVACRTEHDGRLLRFSFEDDGIGLPVNFDPDHHHSLGMKIIDSLSSQLNGRYEWQDLKIGLRFLCHIPTAGLSSTA